MRWVLVDGTWMAHLLKYGLLKSGSIADAPELVLYGYLDAIRRLCVNSRVDSSNVQIFFDTDTSHRRTVDPMYKIHRRKKEKSADEMREEREFWVAMESVLTDYLPKLGVPVHRESGFEADDLIATACKDVSDADDVMIITADGDLWQCLRPNVRWYNPVSNRLVTDSVFRQTVGVSPRDWASVKALAGCSGDNVSGVRGVGEVSAIKYLRGELREDSVYYKRITCLEGIAAERHADQLVRLPFKGTPSVPMTPTKWDRSYFKKMVRERGFESMISGWLIQSWNSMFGRLSLRDLQTARSRTRGATE